MKNIVELKNDVIQARFETRDLGLSVSKYQIKFKNGKSCTMLCMNGSSREDAKRDAINHFGEENILSIS